MEKVYVFYNFWNKVIWRAHTFVEFHTIITTCCHAMHKCTKELMYMMVFFHLHHRAYDQSKEHKLCKDNQKTQISYILKSSFKVFEIQQRRKYSYSWDEFPKHFIQILLYTSSLEKLLLTILHTYLIFQFYVELLNWKI